MPHLLPCSSVWLHLSLLIEWCPLSSKLWILVCSYNDVRQRQRRVKGAARGGIRRWIEIEVHPGWENRWESGGRMGGKIMLPKGNYELKNYRRMRKSFSLKRCVCVKLKQKRGMIRLIVRKGPKLYKHRKQRKKRTCGLKRQFFPSLDILFLETYSFCCTCGWVFTQLLAHTHEHWHVHWIRWQSLVIQMNQQVNIR